MSDEISFKSLFVSDLSPDVTESNLLNAFCSSGPLVSVRIVRHKESRQSLGYGYVNFVEESDARNALNTKNFIEINGQQIRVMAAQSDSIRRKSNNANIFVKNLDKCVDNKRLYDTFKRFGPILSVKLEKEVNGQSKGFGFINFEAEQNAIDAIIAMNGRQLGQKILFCGKFLPKTERQKSMKIIIEVKSYANIYVKNLSPDFSDNCLKQLFITFGPIIAVQVIHNKSKHFGFVCFHDSKTADIAIKALNGKPLPNGFIPHMSRAFKSVQKKAMNCSDNLAQKRSEDRDICVKYLDQSIDVQLLEEVFSPFGQIIDSVIYPPTPYLHYFDRFGFIRFSSPESAQNAVRFMNNKVLANKSIFVSIAHSVSERNKCLATKTSLKPKTVTNIWKQSVGYPIPFN